MPDGQAVSSGPPHGAISVVDRGTEQVLVLAGDLDTVVVAAFERATGCEPVVVAAIDAGDVTLLSATAVDVMLRFHRAAAAAGRPLVLRRSNAQVDRVLNLLRLSDAFPQPAGGA